jgi:hypothetical protein
MCQTHVSICAGQFQWVTVTNRDMQPCHNLETTKMSNPSNFEISRILQSPPINLHWQTPDTRLLCFLLYICIHSLFNYLPHLLSCTTLYSLSFYLLFLLTGFLSIKTVLFYNYIFFYSTTLNNCNLPMLLTSLLCNNMYPYI